MYESGQMHKLQTQWLPRFGSDHCNSLEVESLGFNKVISIFVLILCIVPTCIFLLVCEVCCKFMKNESDHSAKKDSKMDLTGRPIVIKVNQTF